MLRIPLSKQLLLATTAALALAGCPDPEGATNEFVERSAEYRKEKDAAVAQGFFDATGQYLVALASTADPSKPVLFDSAVTVDVEAKTIQINLQPLAVDGRAPVGEEITHTPVAIADDGKFVIDYGEVNIDGAADPLLPGQAIVATMVFSGQTNSESEVCGTVDGLVTAPAMLPLSGSTFGSLKVEDGVFEGLEAITGCPTE